MNKVLRLLLLIGLTAFICSSCSKNYDFPDVPDFYDNNGKLPFNIKIIPKEGCDTLFLYRITENNDRDTLDLINDTTLIFDPGDSLVLETRPKSGYTFINWVRNGIGISNDPIYGFKLDTVDIDSLNHVKYYYEARFGLDYALQVIPSIDKVIPHELIAEMGPYLHFGDNPPTIDSFSCNVLEVFHFIHNSDHPEIPFDSNTMFHRLPGEIFTIPRTFKFYGQHRGVYDSCKYEHYYDYTVVKLYEYANISDSIFIMGNDPEFTIYYNQKKKRRLQPASSGLTPTGGINLIQEESVIVSGIKTAQGIQDLHWGFRVEDYENFEPMSMYNSQVGKKNGIADIHDIYHFVTPQP